MNQQKKKLINSGCGGKAAKIT
jgi:hypothetical protein